MTQTFTLRQRFSLFFITWAAYLAIRLIGPTLRWKVDIEKGGPPDWEFHPTIGVFWHRCVFPSAYRWRHRAIGVMVSSSFDGEYIARILQRFGFLAVRGSSSRGGAPALREMHKMIDAGHSVAFTIDGPRGPKYVAKPGPVMLARNTGLPVLAFHIALEKAWVLKSWDAMMIPKPFTRTLLKMSRLIHAPGDLEGDQLAKYHEEMQAALDRVRIAAEEQMIAETGRCA
ncbi:MAG: lysophospholipid acyltransferase family protein [Terriglobales bacterium]|jgi:lysophospholipid acyltransferase (LPLAT)-like uncharacterized protein